MAPARKLMALVIPATIVICAVLHAQAVSALVATTAIVPPEASLGSPSSASSVGTTGRSPASHERPNADSIIARFAPPPAFDHTGDAPVDCTGIRALVVVQAEDENASLVALDVGGQRMLRRRGMEAGAMTVAWVGADRAWLARSDGATCEARVFAPPVAPVAASPEAKKGDKPVAVQGVVRMSANEVHVDRGTLDKILENPGELSKIRVAPDATGIKIAKVPPNSILAVLGIEEGDRLLKAGGIELTSPEKIMELYARLRSYEKLSIVVERKGKPMTMDYVIK